ncbi:hypothetical protein ACNYDJ_16105 [Phocaeicola vulgatus]|uniref:hypothetical protein n=1 Tax=Phocaeicola vulgatus TaxID=821 RepID=UPI003AB65CB5
MVAALVGYRRSSALVAVIGHKKVDEVVKLCGTYGCRRSLQGMCDFGVHSAQQGF